MQSRFESQRFFVLLSFILVLFLTTYPLLFVGYTTADDVDGLTLADSLPKILSEVKNSGRLSHYVINTVGYARVVLDSFAYLKGLSLAPIVGSILLATYLTYLILGSFNSAVLFFALVCIAQQNSWQHNILTAFPFTIQLAFMSFLASLILFIKFLKNSSWLANTASAFCLAFSMLMYEMFLPFVVVFPIVSLTNYFARDTIRPSQALRSLRFSSLHLLVFFLILGAYLVVRFRTTIYYEGVAMPSDFSLLDYLRAVSIYSLSPIPPLNFLNHEFLYHDLRESFEPFRMQIFYLIVNLRPEWIARAFLIFGLAYFGLMTMPKFKARPLVVLGSFVGVTLLIFLPNILVALSPTKQKWTEAGITTYSGTYLSTFAIVFAATGLLVLGWQTIKRFSKPIQIFSAGIVSFGFTILSISSDQLNYYVSKAQKHDFMLWRLMDEVVKSDRFAEIGEDSLIYAPTLWMTGRYWGLFHASPAMNDYWTRFTYIKTGKTIPFMRIWDSALCASAHTAGKKLYIMKYFQEQDDERYSIALAEVDSGIVDCSQGILDATRSLDVFMMSRYDRVSVVANLVNGVRDSVIYLNNDRRLSTSTNFFAFGISSFNWSDSKKVSHFRLSSVGRPIKLETFRLVFGGDLFLDIPFEHEQGQISLRKN